MIATALILVVFSRGFNNNKALTNWSHPQIIYDNYWNYVSELDNTLEYCFNESVENEAGFVMEDCLLKELEDSMAIENISIWDLHYDTNFDH